MSTLKRYDRQILLPEIGIDGQQKLYAASILVIGAGGLGCPVLLYLAGAGIGKIGIIDNDLVDESNLHRQVLYNMADTDKLKAEIAAAKLRMFNPDVQFQPYAFRLTAKNAAELISKYDLVIDGSDNFPTRYLVNDTCVALNKPLVFGSIFQFEGQVSVFNFKNGPDYRCLYPEPPMPDEVPNCGERGVIGTLPGMIGSLMANEAIKIICGFGEILSGQLLVFNALNNDTQQYKFSNQGIKNKQSTKTDGLHMIINEPFIVNKEAESKIPDTDRSGMQEISMDELEQWKINKMYYQLIDVREIYEYEAYNIGGINIPLYELNHHISELIPYQRIVFCCQAGKRSKMAVHLLRNELTADLFTLIIPPATEFSTIS